jgi:hypothetical protein
MSSYVYVVTANDVNGLVCDQYVFRSQDEARKCRDHLKTVFGDMFVHFFSRKIEEKFEDILCVAR